MFSIDKPDHRLVVERGFTLMEAVIALGVFAFSLAIVLGVFSQSVARNREIRDYQAAERVIAQAPAALAALGWDASRKRNREPGVVELTASGPLLLVADGSGGRLVPLDQAEELPGSDQFFLVSLERDESPGYRFGEDLHGAMVLIGEVSWPFRIPSNEGFREVEVNQRRRHAFSISTRP
jgi:type II secretory pathway pseudopilin PulG